MLATGHFNKSNEIGKGGYGNVFVVLNLRSIVYQYSSEGSNQGLDCSSVLLIYDFLLHTQEGCKALVGCSTSEHC